ncbi:MAG: DUF3996 domain-containing protein [Calditrichaeota bacterium]|nr:MAG: DUF3996 domain-containing protein [Calditrichota bacterium]MBL1206518.1 DUF3996 domain-containing protein [Calditrichota bacterium]NOG46346.1 DUF3996 domain-containing protein [Calditrichota bacterium]
MKVNYKTILTCLFIFIILGSSLSAKTGNETSGVGIILGNPTGLSFKFLDSGATHFNGGLSWSFKNETNLQIHIDYIFKRFTPIYINRDFSLTPTMGIGGHLKTKDSELGVRVPFGLMYEFRETPFDMFIEIAPALDLIPATDFEFSIAIAVRYLF